MAEIQRTTIGELEVVMIDQSNLPSLIKQILYEVLKPTLIRIVSSHNDYKYFLRLEVNFLDNFNNTGDLRAWLYNAYYKPDSFSKSFKNSSSIVMASAETEAATLSGVYKINLWVDNLIFMVTAPYLGFQFTEWEKARWSSGSLSDQEYDHARDRIIELLGRRLIRDCLEKQMDKNVKHEIAHLHHVLRSKSFWKHKSLRIARMISMATPVWGSAKQTGNRRYQILIQNYLLFKMNLVNFSYNLLAEGLGIYSEEPRLKSMELWEKSYAQAKKSAKQLQEDFINLVNITQQFEQDSTRRQPKGDMADSLNKALDKFSIHLLQTPYDIGYHMVYTISFYQGVFDLDRERFYRLYEELCHSTKFNCRPVASLNSTKGIFDVITVDKWIVDNYHLIKNSRPTYIQ